MMNEIQIFTHEKFGEIRTIEENGKIYFCGSDVAKALGYSKPNNAILKHCRYTLKRGIPHPQNPNRIIEMNFIPEGDVYRLITHSKLPYAEKFESWVFDEVLPTIRKTGSYAPKIECSDPKKIEIENVYITINAKQLKKLKIQSINKGSEKTMDYSKEEIKKHLIDYVEEITAKSSGKNQYVCPFCDSGKGKNGTGAFTVYPDTNSYYCFSCQASGDIYSLYGAVNNISDFKTVSKELENKYNPVSEKKDYSYFFNVTAQHLNETDYLTNRGISLKTQRKFNCGYVSNFKYKGNQTTPAVIIPTSNTSFMWRSTTENIKQKRGNAHILNISALNQPYCFVVEGEIDCMSIDDCGFACIGLGSTSNIKKIFDFDTSKTVLIIAMDSDKAGKKARTHLIKLCDEIGTPYIIASDNVWQEYKDANELLVNDRQSLIRTLTTLSEQANKLDINKWKSDLQERKANTPEWTNLLKRSNMDNRVKNNLNNISLILNNDETYKDKIEFNELKQIRTFCRNNWQDVMDSQLLFDLETKYDLTTTIQHTNHVCNIIANKHRYHPIKEYIEQTTWDGIHRIKSIFTDFLGATDNIYTQHVAIISFVGAVARIYNAGIKFDTCTVFVGKQGIGKSKFLGKIAVKAEWFTDGVTTFDGKDFYESIQGKWIIELGEGTAFQKSIKERTKQALSSTIDYYRKPYGHNPEERPRQCVFFGSTNNYDFLKDETGDRRYYPIDVNISKATKSIDTDLTSEYIAQLWAEALYLYSNGQSIYIKDKQVLTIAEQEQRKHFDESPLQADILNFLEIPITKEWYNLTLDTRKEYIRRYQKGENTAGAYKRDRISIKEIACELFGYDLNQPIDRKFSLDIARTLMALGWNKTGKAERITPYGVVKVYIK